MDGVIIAGGNGEGPRLVFLHGLGAHACVWRPMLDGTEKYWPGRWIAIDLPGHGRGPRSEKYGLDEHATHVADTLKANGDSDGYIVLGHSMGGAIGLELASGRYGVTPGKVLALGVKVIWSNAELAWLDGLAKAPAKTFTTMEEAIDRFLKVSGLAGLVDAGSDAARKGVRQPRGEATWRLAADPAAATVGPPPMDALMAAARCPVRLAAGELDPMSKVEDLRRWDPEAVVLPGLGHNAMVEDPAAVWRWVRPECGLD